MRGASISFASQHIPLAQLASDHCTKRRSAAELGWAGGGDRRDHRHRHRTFRVAEALSRIGKMLAATACGVLQSVGLAAKGPTAMTPGSLQQVIESPASAGCWTSSLEPPRVRYFKRYRMEIDLNGLPGPELPEGYTFIGWHPSLLDAHAQALYASFRDGLDTQIFPSLGSHPGCLQ